MEAVKTWISKDKSYKPSSPASPEQRFFIETDAYRWDVYVSRYGIRETGTAVYHAVTDEGHSSYGLTANEAVNGIAEIMRLKLANAHTREVSLDDVRHYLDPLSVAREEIKAAEVLSRKPLLIRLFGL